MTITEKIQKLTQIAEEMGVALYQRFSEDEAVEFLNIPIQSLILLRGQGKILFIGLLWLSAFRIFDWCGKFGDNYNQTINFK